jgi:hypothetical protein
MEKKKIESRTNLKLIIGSVLVTAVILGIVITSLHGKAPRLKIANEGQILSVNDIQADPYAYKGAVTITGVVADKSRFRNLPQDVFLIIETSEAKICKITGCAKFYLPVRYEGSHPEEWDEVNITGSFSEDRELIFKATKVDVLRHLTF